jgi:hypothetical protein
MITLFVLFGLLSVFLSYSMYFSIRVSKGLPLQMLYNLVYGDPIEDYLLHHTFHNLFWCRVSLMVAWALAIGFGGAVYAFLK